MQIDERARWQFGWQIRKWRHADYEAGRPPYEVLTVPGNLLLNSGINALQRIGIGDGTIPAFGAGSYLKVGNSATAAVNSQTDLQGGSTFEKAMAPTFPSVSGQVTTWEATFGAAEANFAWNEMGIKNGAGAISATVKMLNRKVQAMGTKPGTEVWTVTATLTLA
jgi:hypothetical protein